MGSALQPTQKSVDGLAPELQPLRALLASIGQNHANVPRQQGANYAPAAPSIWDQLYKGQNAQSNNGPRQQPNSLYSAIIPLLAAWQQSQQHGAAPVAAQNNPAPTSTATSNVPATMNPNTPAPVSMSPSTPVATNNVPSTTPVQRPSAPATPPVDTGTRFVPPTNIPISIDPTGIVPQTQPTPPQNTGFNQDAGNKAVVDANTALKSAAAAENVGAGFNYDTAIRQAIAANPGSSQQGMDPAALEAGQHIMMSHLMDVSNNPNAQLDQSFLRPLNGVQFVGDKAYVPGQELQYAQDYIAAHRATNDAARNLTLAQLNNGPNSNMTPEMIAALSGGK